MMKQEISGEAQEKYYAQWLSSLLNFRGRSGLLLLKAFGSLAAVFALSEETLEKELGPLLPPGQKKLLLENRRQLGAVSECLSQCEMLYHNMEEKGIRFVWYGEREFPKRLLQIPDPPFGLYYRGRLPEEDSPAVAIVGARECSEYGRYVAEALGRFLGSRGVSVISGMARGIDGNSQEAALAAKGSSYGVLGCGVDICYPSSHRKLYEMLLAKGGIVSEYPPGTQPIARNFPPRNRIVSGLADAVVVIEARGKSGTLITVDMALEQGKEVYVVPGRITDRLSDGCNMLLKQGAGVFLSPQTFLQELEELWERKQGAREEAVAQEEAEEEKPRRRERTGEKAVAQEKAGTEKPQRQERTREEGAKTEWRELTEPLQEVYETLDFTPRSPEEIKSRLSADYTGAKVNALLMKLCLEQLATQVSPGHFCLRMPL